MKKIEESENESETSKKDLPSEETDKVEILQDSKSHKKPDSLTIDFQISKKNIKTHEDPQKVHISEETEEIGEGEEIFETQEDMELDEMDIDYENFESNKRKAKYEDGTWKFF